MTRLLAIALLLGSIASTAAGEDLAQQAIDILDARCAHCHGGDGAAEGGLDFVLNVDKLKRRNQIVPGKPDASELLTRVESGDMPADDTMPKEEIALLRKWIAAGAPSPGGDAPQVEFIAPQQMYALIERDLLGLSSGQRRFKRYFTLTHLAGSGTDANELELYRQGLSKLVNSLSWGNNIVPPQPIDSSGTILRIDLRDYQWSTATWDRILEANPYKVVFQDSSAEFSRAVTKTDHPVIRADWFAANASVPPLYHDILGIPVTERELEELIGLDTKDNVKKFKAIRAGFNSSGVSRNNRMIERHDSQYGAYWRSYDFAGNSGRQNIFARPLGPDGDDSFEHDGGEIIFNLPNGLQGYMLSDGSGNRIEKGPTAIVSDPKRPDRAVVNGLSCMSCHSAGIIPKKDQIRDSVLGNLDLFDERTSQEILALYPSNKRIEALMDEDIARFAKALTKAGVTSQKTEPVSALVLKFEQELDLGLAAAEAGMSSDQFLRALEVTPSLALAFGPLRATGGTINREVFLQNFQDLAAQLGLDRNVRFNSLRMRMVEIPAGGFTMGSSQSDPQSRADERNQHRVEVTRGFYMAAHEVTVAQYLQFVEATDHKGPYGYRYDPDAKQFIQNANHDWRNPGFDQTDEHPVINVSYDDALAFCRWLSEQEGVKYRLPTEAEWEYACRADSQTRFSGTNGGSELAQIANLADASLKEELGFGEAFDDGQAFTAKVGRFKANAFGLFDMHGNVAEWCSDYYSPSYYRNSPTFNPLGPDSGKQRVVRGGSWATTAEHARAAERLAVDPDERNLLIGFRVVREIE